MGYESRRAERMVYAFRVTSGQEGEIRAAAADIRAIGEEYGRSREELGLTDISVWLQDGIEGPLVLLMVEGDLERYFKAAGEDPGIDGWFREKIAEWTGSSAAAADVYAYPQSEELFRWSADPGGD